MSEETPSSTPEPPLDELGSFDRKTIANYLRVAAAYADNRMAVLGVLNPMIRRLEAPITPSADEQPFSDEVARMLAGALNGLLALWTRENGLDYNIVDRSLDALAVARNAYPDLPITASFYEEVERRRAAALPD